MQLLQAFGLFYFEFALQEVERMLNGIFQNFVNGDKPGFLIIDNTTDG